MGVFSVEFEQKLGVYKNKNKTTVQFLPMNFFYKKNVSVPILSENWFCNKVRI